MQKDRDVDLNVVYMVLKCYITILPFLVALKYKYPLFEVEVEVEKGVVRNRCYSYANGNWK